MGKSVCLHAHDGVHLLEHASVDGGSLVWPFVQLMPAQLTSTVCAWLVACALYQAVEVVRGLVARAVCCVHECNALV
jgi:hypothetical protein